MSIRTIIEINHDYLRRLADNPNQLRLWLHGFASLGMKEQQDRAPEGIRVLAQRHHADTITLKVE